MRKFYSVLLRLTAIAAWSSFFWYGSTSELLDSQAFQQFEPDRNASASYAQAFKAWEEPTHQSLRSLATNQGLYLGAAVNVKALQEDPLYPTILAREFNGVTAENDMKFERLQPQRNRFDFAQADLLMGFAAENQMQVRGHTLVWHNALPTWLEDGNWTREEAIAILENHIKTVVGRYRGRVIAWDVVNEAILGNGTLRDSFWLENIGPEYLEMAFTWAHEADPDAVLIYNDYGGEGVNRKSDAIYDLVKSLQEKGVPIHGVGLQMHVAVNAFPDPEAVAENMRRIANLGLQVHITEMDVRIQQPSTQEDFERQADVYKELLEVCLLAENCNTFIFWGFTDQYSWVPIFFDGWDEALLWDKTFQPKPAYYRILELLSAYAK